MAETLTNTNGAVVLKQSTTFNRPFFFGTASQTVSVFLSKNGGAWAAAAGAVTEIGGAGNGRGWYQVALSAVDSNTAGILGYNCTASSGGPVDFSDLVQTTIFPDLMLNGGRVFINSALIQNQPLTLMFTMTVAGVPTPGLTVTGQRNFGSGWSNISGTISELSNGDYKVILAAADTNAQAALYRFIAPGADDRNVGLMFDP